MIGGSYFRVALTASVVVMTAAYGGTASLPSVVSRSLVTTRAGADAPSSASVVIPNNARVHGYQTTRVTLAQGGTLSAVNLDAIEHTVTSDDKGTDGLPLFDSIVPPNTTVTIRAASTLAAGTYKFHCNYHPQTMVGQLVVEGGSGGVHPVPPKFEQPLVIPKRLTGAHLRIPITRASVRVLPHGPLTKMWTYGGTYPGPTIERPAGRDTKVTFVDKLPSRVGPLTVHLHGDHHASVDDGQPTTHLIRHGHSRTYDYPLKDGGHPERGASLWYHDHLMGRTGRNVWMGMQGMFIITDARERKLPLPGGRYDVPLMISERTFTSTNQLTNPFPKHATMLHTGPAAPPDDATVGKQILANGRFAPYLKVSAHRYRLRLVNGSNFTPYDFVLSDGRPFVQIGTGNGLLTKPVVRQDILLGPAQRADVVVDFHGELHHNVLLESAPRSDKRPADAIGTPTAAIMQFRVARTGSRDRTRVPGKLRATPAIRVPHKVSKTWTFNVAGDKTHGSYWTVNGKQFDAKRVDAKVPLGSTQLWKLHNASPITHFIHLHEEQWHTISRDGHRPPPWERGLEDTWKLDPGETVTVAARFTDHTGVFMIHCHMLNHEDDGLMAQFQVVRPRGHSVQRTVAAPVRAAVPRPAGIPSHPTKLVDHDTSPLAAFVGQKDFMCMGEGDAARNA